MKLTKLFGAIIAFSLIITPASNLPFIDKSATSITASAASAGVYVTNKVTHNYGLRTYHSYSNSYEEVYIPYNQISLVKGTYVYSDGLEVWGPDYRNTNYCIPYIRISVQGTGYWVPKDNLNFYR